MTKISLQTDILVGGGGMAGVMAATAAARCGAKVILCQDRPVLGGNASSEIRMHAVGADCSGGRGIALETEAREGGVIEEIRLENSVRNPQRSPSVFDLILYDLCRREPNITLLLNTVITGCEQRNGLIRNVTAKNFQAETYFDISAKVYIDCTGDGALGLHAGAEYRQGREAASEFSESLAGPRSDNKRLGTSLMFQARLHDRPMPFTAPPWARNFTENQLVLRPHADISRNVDTGLEYGYWWLEWGGNLDTIGDNEKIRDELLAVMLGVWDHVKNGGDHGADNWALEWMGFLPGKRESRRFTGLTTLTQDDIMESVAQPDAIAYGGWPIDVHPPGGVDAVSEEPCTQHRVPHLYDIPLRACLSRNISNLMFAGRNISVSHIALASTRVMATVAAIGQGVGTAAACAVREGVPVSKLPEHMDMMHSFQQQLLRDDAFLIGIGNEDPNDLARRAVPTASSQLPDGVAGNVNSGQTRSVHGAGGVASHRTEPGSWRWMSDPECTLPQWIELAWEEPVSIGSVELVFDTGMHRVLTLSQSDTYTAMMQWGQPQIETVRDYSIAVRVAGSWSTLLHVTGNYQRKRVHVLDGHVLTKRMRFTVMKTNGIDHARICEIRVYG